MTTKTAKQNEIDWAEIDGSNQDFTDVYPRIQWHHGKRQFEQLGGMVFTGGLFVPNDQFSNFSADGWEESSFISSQNEKIEGNFSAMANLAIIRVKTFWNDKGSHTHAICCVKGMEDVFCLQVGGISKGQAFNQLFQAHRTQIVAVANRTKPEGAKGLEPFALWCVIQPDAHSQQTNKNDASKSSEVTRPILYTPKEVTLDYVRTLYVGTDNYKRFCRIYKETEAWQKQIPVANIIDNVDNSRISDETLQQIIKLAGIKEYDLRELALTVSLGSTSMVENLTPEEGQQVLETLQSY